MFQTDPDQLVLAAKAFGEMAHLAWKSAPPGAKVAICGTAVAVSGKAFLYITQVGCKDCRTEYAKILSKKEGES